MKFDYTKYKAFYCADFETSTAQWNIEKARVWAWDICDTALNHINGNSISTFFDELSKPKYNKCLLSFHNLAYDGCYILDYILNNGYRFVADEPKNPKEFTTVITPLGQHYAYQIIVGKNLITINDSFKHNSQSVERLAKTYKLSIQKGKIDYDKVREEGHLLTNEEIEYIHGDTEIVMQVLNDDIENGFTRFTESGNSKIFFEKSISHNKDEYLSIFPIISDDEDKFVRKAYRGGYCYLNSKYFNKIINSAMSVDINSMYPAMMLHNPLPYGEGFYVEGYAVDSKIYAMIQKTCKPLFVQHLYIMCKLKNNKPPVIANKSFGTYNTKQKYLTDSQFKMIELWVTNVDLELIYECYDIFEIEFIDAYIYRSCCGNKVDHEKAKNMTVDEIIEEDGKGALYYNYLKPWRYMKEHSTGGARDRAKKNSNVAYGWQGTSRNPQLAYPTLDKYGKLCFKKYVSDKRESGYVPIAAFITAHSRSYLIRQIINNFDRFIYCDTDSLYLVGQDIPNIPIHNTLYGYFKIEHYISKAKFLGTKRYIYETNDYSPSDPNQFIVKCCGAPLSVTQQMTFDNFVPYNEKTGEGEFDGKIQSKIVIGGKHLEITTYKLIC